MAEHLGHENNRAPEVRNTSNVRNGSRPKTVLTEATGQVEIEVPRDRDSTFEPQIVKKRQRRLTGFVMINCGIDWAKAHHDVASVDENGRLVGRTRVLADAAGFTELLGFIAEHGETSETTPVAIETEKNLFVVALAKPGFNIFPMNPAGGRPLSGTPTPRPAGSPTRAMIPARPSPKPSVHQTQGLQLPALI